MKLMKPLYIRSIQKKYLNIFKELEKNNRKSWALTPLSTEAIGCAHKKIEVSPKYAHSH